MPEIKANTPRSRPVIEVLAASVGMAVLVAFSHRGLPWILVSVAGFLLTAGAIAPSLRSAAQSLALLGLGGFSRKTVLFTLVGGIIGIAGGLRHRAALGLPLLPVGGLQAFIGVACLIAATEELIYRGWLQGRIRTFGWPMAVAAATIAHGLYKAALFAWPPGFRGLDMECVSVGLGAAAMGIVPGLLREFSGSVVPAIMAHAAFDLILYGAVARAPWWVWT
jgi:membrane protease YdiL (CAAX protease family)